MHRSRIPYRPFGRRPLLLASALALLPAGLSAQELPWVPRGQLRLDFAPKYWTWNTRYGVGPDGEEREESIGLDLTGDPLGSAALPGLRTLEANLAAAMGDPSYRVRLGASRATIDQSRLTFPFRIDLGITDRLTVGAVVPIHRPRTELAFALDADSLSADVGFSPMIDNSSAVFGFVNDFQAALTAAYEAHPDDPAVAEAQAYLTAVFEAYNDFTFFPLAGTPGAQQLQGRLDAIRGALNDLGVGGVPETLPFPSGYLTTETFQEFLSGQAMAGYPLEDWTTLWSLGDIEITASVRILQGGFEPDSLGNLPTFRYQLGGGALVRLGTGKRDDYHRFLDLRPADGQNDLEANAFGAVEVGSRFGAWGRIRFGIQMEGEIYQRIADSEGVLPPRASLAPLKWTPGNYFEVDLNPRFFLTPGMSFGVRYHLWSKGADSHVLAVTDPETLETRNYPAAELLDDETEQTLQELGFSATLSSVEAYERGEASLPVQVRATFFKPLSGSGGQTPKGGRFEAGVSIFQALWGRSSREPQ